MLYSVLGLFNSKLANWWFVKKYGVLMEVGGFKIGRLPLPTEWNTGAVQLGDLVSKLLGLHEQTRNMRTDHEKIALQRQVDATDQQIDKQVYELYGLTQEEIRLIEEGQ